MGKYISGGGNSAGRKYFQPGAQDAVTDVSVKNAPQPADLFYVQDEGVATHLLYLITAWWVKKVGSVVTAVPARIHQAIPESYYQLGVTDPVEFNRGVFILSDDDNDGIFTVDFIDPRASVGGVLTGLKASYQFYRVTIKQTTDPKAIYADFDVPSENPTAAVVFFRSGRGWQPQTPVVSTGYIGIAHYAVPHVLDAPRQIDIPKPTEEDSWNSLMMRSTKIRQSLPIATALRQTSRRSWLPWRKS